MKAGLAMRIAKLEQAHGAKEPPRLIIAGTEQEAEALAASHRAHKGEGEPLIIVTGVPRAA